jgi:hypothetical protein
MVEDLDIVAHVLGEALVLQHRPHVPVGPDDGVGLESSHDPGGVALVARVGASVVTIVASRECRDGHCNGSDDHQRGDRTRCVRDISGPVLYDAQDDTSQCLCADACEHGHDEQRHDQPAVVDVV